MPGLPAPNSSDCSTSASDGSTLRVCAGWDEYTKDAFGTSVVLGAATVITTAGAVTVTGAGCAIAGADGGEMTAVEDAMGVDVVVDVVDVR